jgi:hypothetical protein
MICVSSAPTITATDNIIVVSEMNFIVAIRERPISLMLGLSSILYTGEAVESTINRARPEGL